MISNNILTDVYARSSPFRLSLGFFLMRWKRRYVIRKTSIFQDELKNDAATTIAHYKKTVTDSISEITLLRTYVATRVSSSANDTLAGRSFQDELRELVSAILFQQSMRDSDLTEATHLPKNSSGMERQNLNIQRMVSERSKSLFHYLSELLEKLHILLELLNRRQFKNYEELILAYKRTINEMFWPFFFFNVATKKSESYFVTWVPDAKVLKTLITISEDEEYRNNPISLYPAVQTINWDAIGKLGKKKWRDFSAILRDLNIESQTTQSRIGLVQKIGKSFEAEIKYRHDMFYRRSKAALSDMHFLNRSSLSFLLPHSPRENLIFEEKSDLKLSESSGLFHLCSPLSRSGFGWLVGASRHEFGESKECINAEANLITEIWFSVGGETFGQVFSSEFETSFEDQDEYRETTRLNITHLHASHEFKNIADDMLKDITEIKEKLISTEDVEKVSSFATICEEAIEMCNKAEFEALHISRQSRLLYDTQIAPGDIQLNMAEFATDLKYVIYLLIIKRNMEANVKVFEKSERNQHLEVERHIAEISNYFEVYAEDFETKEDLYIAVLKAALKMERTEPLIIALSEIVRNIRCSQKSQKEGNVNSRLGFQITPHQLSFNNVCVGFILSQYQSGLDPEEMKWALTRTLPIGLRFNNFRFGSSGANVLDIKIASDEMIESYGLKKMNVKAGELAYHLYVSPSNGA